MFETAKVEQAILVSRLYAGHEGISRVGSHEIEEAAEMGGTPTPNPLLGLLDIGIEGGVLAE